LYVHEVYHTHKHNVPMDQGRQLKMKLLNDSFAVWSKNKHNELSPNKILTGVLNQLIN